MFQKINNEYTNKNKLRNSKPVQRNEYNFLTKIFI